MIKKLLLFCTLVLTVLSHNRGAGTLHLGRGLQFDEDLNILKSGPRRMLNNQRPDAGAKDIEASFIKVQSKDPFEEDDSDEEDLRQELESRQRSENKADGGRRRLTMSDDDYAQESRTIRYFKVRMSCSDDDCLTRHGEDGHKHPNTRCQVCIKNNGYTSCKQQVDLATFDNYTSHVYRYNFYFDMGPCLAYSGSYCRWKSWADTFVFMKQHDGSFCNDRWFIDSIKIRQKQPTGVHFKNLWLSPAEDSALMPRTGGKKKTGRKDGFGWCINRHDSDDSQLSGHVKYDTCYQALRFRNKCTEGTNRSTCERDPEEAQREVVRWTGWAPILTCGGWGESVKWCGRSGTYGEEPCSDLFDCELFIDSCDQTEFYTDRPEHNEDPNEDMCEVTQFI